MIFDTHAHYDDHAFDADREAVIRSLPSFGVEKAVNVGASLRGCRESIRLSGEYPSIYAAVGIHPDECLLMEESWMEELRTLAGSTAKCVAIGEIGLDYHGFEIYDDKPDKETQKKWFRRQLCLAAELSLPVIVHSRNACEDTVAIMREARETLGIKDAVIHCFSYSRETAEEFVKMGYYLGFGGSTTYEGQKKITKVLKAVPMERILLETDCPYLSPVPHRGERNFSGNLPYVRDRIAEIREISPEEVERITRENALRFYRIAEEERKV